MNNNTNKIYKYLLALLGLFLVLYYIWFRFIRERLPKDIPFNLSIQAFFILLEITLIYLFVCISFAGSSNNNNFFKALVDWLFIPLDELHIFLRKHVYTSKFFDKYYSFILEYNERIIRNFSTIYIIIRIFPRMILLSTLCIDIFYFHRLCYIYKVLLIGLIILIARFLTYSIKMYQKELLKESNLYIKYVIIDYIPGVVKEDDDDDEDGDIPPSMVIPLEKFIELQMNSIIKKNKEFEYSLRHKPAYWKYIEKFSSKEKEEEFDKQLDLMLKNLLTVSLLIKYYGITENKFNTTTFFIFFTYYICWGSILLLSLHTLNLYSLIIVINQTWINVPNPFF